MVLASCKSFLGCEGGSSLLDPDGEIKNRVNSYLDEYPGASFKEVEKECFEGLDGNISLFALSPRHFEVAITKTLQILVEGYYGGIFKPWIHYIPLKKDFSNIQQVLYILKDKKKCQEIIDTCYNDIVKSDLYTYRAFVKIILSEIKVKSVKRSLKYKMRWSLTRLILFFRDLKIVFRLHLIYSIKAPLVNYYGKNFQKTYRKFESLLRI